MYLSKSFLSGALIALLLTGCLTQTIRFDEKERDYRDPQFSEMKDYFLWGVFPRYHEIDVVKMCGGKEPQQIQSRTTGLDYVLTLVTLGIYAPRNARIWCE